MATTINPAVQPSYAYPQEKASILKRFTAWTAAQQENRLLWLALALGEHGCVLTPLTILLVVALTGLNLFLFMAALAAMAMALVVNLAALPTKITIPVFFIGILIDVAVIAAAVGMAS
jgi:hypothetical protein